MMVRLDSTSLDIVSLLELHFPAYDGVVSMCCCPLECPDTSVNAIFRERLNSIVRPFKSNDSFVIYVKEVGASVALEGIAGIHGQLCGGAIFPDALPRPTERRTA
jgi:hypothetical protein